MRPKILAFNSEECHCFFYSSLFLALQHSSFESCLVYLVWLSRDLLLEPTASQCDSVDTVGESILIHLA